MIRGRVLYVDKNKIYLSRGRKLLRSIDGGKTWCEKAILPVNISSELFVFHRLGRRLFRVGFHHLVEMGTNSSIVVAHRHIFKLNVEKKKLERITRLRGSRPLSLCMGEGLVCYGEYRGNPERSPVYIWASRKDLRQWRPVWSLEGVRHVHGVFFDPFTSFFWITTGDNNDESGIWITRDRFRNVERIIGGSQKFRTVHLLFTKSFIYFGSDAPNELNYIYRLDRYSGRIETLVHVGGPIFYGCKVGNCLFFSTVVEPSEMNCVPYAEIWGSVDGLNWMLVGRFCKDIWPLKYFQYGQVVFPAGPGDNENLWFTPISTVFDQVTFKVKVDSLLKKGFLSNSKDI